jgi:predicted nucleic acid-binding Zn ribbon protein
MQNENTLNLIDDLHKRAAELKIQEEELASIRMENLSYEN